MALDALDTARIDLNFLRNWLAFRGFADVITGSSQPQITRGNITRIELPVPPLGEQRRIAAILDQANDLRRKRRVALKRQNEITSSLLDVTLKGRRHPESFVRLDSLVRSNDRINYGVIQPGPEVDDGVPLIRVENLVNDNFTNEKLKRISSTIEAQYTRSRLKGDEILVACVGSVGAVALAQRDHAEFNIARAVARVPIDPSKADRIFVAECLRHYSTQKYFETEIRAVAQPTLNIKQLCETPIPTVTLDVQRIFAAHVTKIEKLKAARQAHLAQLDTLFGSLQHRAFRNEL